MILVAQSIEKEFIQGKTHISVLKGLNLQVQRGETVAIVGKSGSGKSTLLSILSGLDNADKGSLRLLDENIYAMDEDAITRFRAHHMGIVFQNFHLLAHLSALENIALPMEILGMKNSRERAWELIDKVNLKDRAEHLPSKLSGGEKQRVAVARALASSPDIILADEPSGSLDEETGESVMSLLFELIESEQRAMVLVTHDKDLAKKCSRQLLLDHGILSEIN